MATTTERPAPRKVAVIGSGISGLGAAWLLQRNGISVTLYEKESTCGGHTLTDNSSPWPVDLGFQVFNLTTYPNLVGLLNELGVDSEPSCMSFALSLDEGRLEWGSHSIDSVFAQRGNVLSPAFWGMISDVLRFNREAPKVLDDPAYANMTLGEYLIQQKFSQQFEQNYVLPMCAAVWSVPSSQVRAFPLVALVRFWVNHHLLQVTGRPVWRVVKGRSKSYVDAVLKTLTDVRINTPVTSITPGTSHVTVTTATSTDTFDAVLLATHSDTSHRLLQASNHPACPLLKAIPYADNEVWLHSDASLMPRNRRVWASWNFIGSTTGSTDDAPVCVSYYVNRLQHLPPDAPDLFVTLNPPHPPAKDTVYCRHTLAHPVFDAAALKAQSSIADVQGQGNVWFAGAWMGYGFHEDGLKAAVETVTAMTQGVARAPWPLRRLQPSYTWTQAAAMQLFDKFARRAVTRGHLRVVLPNGMELGPYGNGEVGFPLELSKGETWRQQPQLRATVRVHDWSFFSRVIMRHDTGLGEAYMGDAFDSDNLPGLLTLLCINAHELEANRGALGLLNYIGDRMLYYAHQRRSNTVEGSRKNIEEHYDAGNAMYKLFLDKSMTYSSGIHVQGEDDLYAAQLRKIDALIDKAGIVAEDRVLEIGCGWGAFAIRAVERTGCHVTGVTVSREQLNEARARVKAAGLEDHIELLFCDYRHIKGTFDKVVSCEMIEAVGHEHMEGYFAAIGRALRPGGRAALQAISEPDDRYEAYCASSDFIREHIFPGGHLPCMGVMLAAGRAAGLVMTNVEDIGPDYAVTLREWRARWEQNKDAILALGYSERFWRKYRFYFAYCEAGFDARYIHNFQLVFTKQGGAQASDTDAGMPQVAPSAKAGEEQVAGTDYSLQLLLSVYFFLAGAMVSTKPLLLVVPASSAVFAALQPVARSVYVAAQVCMLGAAAVLSALLHAQGSVLQLIRVAICIAAGYCGFGLWQLVRGGGRVNAHANNTLALVLQLAVFGVSAYKGAGCTALVGGAVGAMTGGVPAALAWVVSAGMLLGHDGVVGLLAAGSVLVASVHAIGW